jgi:plastocyanin
MRAFALAALRAVLIGAGIFAGLGEGASAVDWSGAQRVDVRMTEYEFIPSVLRVRHGTPYQLHLVNTGKEGHDFTAPDFFAAVEVKDRVAFNGGKSIYLRPGEAADIYFIAPTAGLFAPRCADHDWAGMTATIIVD